jgi:hypothetical protein
LGAPLRRIPRHRDNLVAVARINGSPAPDARNSVADQPRD